MSSPASHVISKDDLLKLRYYYIVRKWGKEVVLLIYNFTFLHGSSRTIRQILEDNGVSFGRRSPFNNTEVDRLTNHPAEALDITVLNKICQQLWGMNVNHPGDTLCNLVKKIKDERNNVSHGEDSMSESELDDKLLEFKETLEDALEEAKSHHLHHAVHFDSLKSKINDAVVKVKEKIREKYDPTNPKDWERYQAELEEYDDLLCEFIREKAEKELVNIYTVLCRMLPFDWLTQYGVVSPCNFMVTLKMDTHKEFHGSLVKEVVTIDQRQLLKMKDPENNDPRVVIVSGDAGSGKTTLLSSLVENWYKKTHDIPNLSSFQILLYMQFRTHNFADFDSYLEDLLEHTVLKFNYRAVKSSILSSNCLFLCDGFDESNPDSIKLFKNILKLHCKNMKIIVTTRPGKTEDLTYLVNISKHRRINLNVLGLRKEDMEMHIETLTRYLVNNDEVKRKEVMKEITQLLKTISSPLMRILKTPLWFNLFIVLFVECPDLRNQLNNQTLLYLQVRKHRKKRLANKIEVTEEELSEFDKEYTKWSLHYYTQKKFELTEDDVNNFKRKCVELGLDFHPVMSSYFNIKHAYKDLDITKIYCYRHLSEQEFNAAFAICDQIRNFHEEHLDEFNAMKEKGDCVVRKFLSNVGDKYAQKKLLIFITGILFNKDINLLRFLMGDILNLHYQFSGESESLLGHLFETQNADFALNEVANLFDKKKWQELSMESSITLFCLPSLLPKMNLRLIKNFLEEDPEDLPHLLTALEAANQNNVKTDIIHIPQFHSACGGFSDRSLEAAENCRTFQGKLTSDGIKKLPERMSRLFIRVEFDQLSVLMHRLNSLKYLKEMEIFFQCDDDVDPDSLTPFVHKITQYEIHMTTGLNLNSSPQAEKLAKVFNALWPKREKGNKLNMIRLIPPKLADLTGDSVEKFCKLLKISPVSFWILRTSREARDKKMELSKMWSKQNGGTLTLF